MVSIRSPITLLFLQGGNNGTTVTAGIIANKYNMCWNTKDGEKKPNYFGSITQVNFY